MVNPPEMTESGEKKRGRETATSDSNGNSGNHNNGNIDFFLNSMTFAAPGGAALARGGCDCDECGGSAFVPQAIIEAIRKHKRQKREQMPMKRSQMRELLQRYGSIAVYKMTLPQASDPLVEFGSSHRLVWIQHLPENSVLKTIGGKGIVGSQDEERGRKDLNWKQGDVYLVPSNGGKAVAWLHEQKPSQKDDNDSKADQEDSFNNNNTNTNNNKPSGHAIMYVCKIPQGSLDEAAEETANEETINQDEPTSWHKIIRKACRDALDSIGQSQANTTSQADKDDSLVYFQLSQEASPEVRQTLSNF